uniref:BTB domain-containing protein n=1 Tax=Lates calcarifer TaxID=8187 RepID=A0A4W6FUC4_LATCA
MPAPGSSHAQRVLSSLNQQRAVGKFCDAVLNVGGGVVYLAHRNILACFSELFQQPSMPVPPTPNKHGRQETVSNLKRAFKISSLTQCHFLSVFIVF